MEATRAVVQLRPDSLGRPQLSIYGVCPRHRRAVVAWCSLTFAEPGCEPEDMTLNFLEDHYLPEWFAPSDDGLTILTSYGVG